MSFDRSFSSSFDVIASPDPIPPGDPQTACWLTEEQLDFFASEYPDLTPEQIDALCLEATWVLDELTHNYYHGEECWSDTFSLRGDQCDFILSHGPVTEIQSVQQMHNCDSTSTNITGWCEISPGKVSICPATCGGRVYNTPWHCGCPKRIRVVYTIGSNLPPGARAAVYTLATEYANAITEGKKCNLPERITSITRQGVSWTLLDPGDFMDKGLVGISRIDSWISIARRSVPKGKAIDPLRYGHWLFSKQVGYGACEVTP